ncbi:hypothetical protein FFLO_06924 [Filobasidium floriforme]|uniref:DUF7107 domain-containing protein n=1 Tax=Filobasidium floriforme TaxID=5210 RepID=A0A8K0JEG1_9TREE|nr:hypothetical protein FFLO_06924 [Filobasidium floriforme]
MLPAPLESSPRHLCLQGSCTPKTAAPIGGACGADNQCPAGVACKSNICGGADAYCTGNEQCASGYACLRNRCSSRPSRELGETCGDSTQCPSSVTCASGICGGQYAYCNNDASLCAPGSRAVNVPWELAAPTSFVAESKPIAGAIPPFTCLVDGRCSAQAPAAVDEPCITDPQCAGDSRCTRSICGGLGGYCPDDQACASGLTCLRNICSSLTAVNIGDACNADSQCPTASTGSVYCRSFECGGYGAYCSTPDGIYPGPSPQCRSDYTCLAGICSPRAASSLGEACGVSEQCPSGVSCSQYRCGGPGSYCTVRDGSTSGPSDQCASSLNCVNNVCVELEVDVPLGQLCTSDTQCADGVSCSETDKKCGGIDASCESAGVCYSSKYQVHHDRLLDSDMGVQHGRTRLRRQLQLRFIHLRFGRKPRPRRLAKAGYGSSSSHES